MKTMTILPIERAELGSVLAAASFTFTDWIIKANEKDEEEIAKFWQSQLKIVKNLQNYLRDTEQPIYYIYDDLFQLR